jgi:hypothetical protein
MARFRKKPVEVEAVRFVEMMEGSVVEEFKAEGLPAPWISEAYLKPMDEPGSLFSNGNGLMIRTLEGDLHVSPGDWIIRGTAGEIYPCKPEIFEQIYEPVGE